VALDTTPGHARLAITDHREPLPPDIEAIFRPFVSVRRPDREGNLGLGLYVAKVIAGRHGGAIRAEPTADRPGARFIVALPLLGH
jgi:K+-sensing histidine kinase KdpD